MITFFTVVLSLLVFGLVVWTITTYITKEAYQKNIKTELSNIFEIIKMFFVSIKSLVQLLLKAYSPSKTNDLADIDDQLLKFVPKTSDNQEENKAA